MVSLARHKHTSFEALEDHINLSAFSLPHIFTSWFHIRLDQDITPVLSLEIWSVVYGDTVYSSILDNQSTRHQLDLIISMKSR